MDADVWLAKALFQSSRRDFYEDMAEALDDRDTVAMRLQNLSERADQEKDVVAPLYRLWLRRMDDRSFGRALDGTVPQGEVMIIQSAEDAGTLADGLRFTVKVMESASVMKGSLFWAVFGFVVSSSVLVLILTLYSFFGIGLIEEVVPADAWPWLGMMLRDLARFVTSWGIWVLAGAAATAALYLWSLKNWYGELRVMADRWIPFYTIYRDFSGAMFLVSMAALMRNRVNLNDALEALEKDASPWLKWHIRQIVLGLDYHSNEPGKAFDTGLFSKPMTWRIIDFGKRSKKFAESVEKVGLRSIDKVVQQVKGTSKFINVILTFVTGGMLAFIVVATLQTVFEAQNAVQQQVNSTTTK